MHGSEDVSSASLLAFTQQQFFLLDSIQAGIIVHGRTSEVLYINRIAAELMGIPRTALLGAEHSDPRWDFIREDGSTLPLDEYPIARVFATGKAMKRLILGYNRGTDGKVIWAMCDAYPMHDRAGEISRVIVSFTDITELKEAERALQKSDERLRLVLQGSQDASWDWDLVTDVLYFSPRWWQMLGYPVDAYPADAVLWDRILHADDRPRVDREFASALAGAGTSYEIEYRLARSDGRYMPVLSRGFITRDASGNPIRVSGTNSDLTERKAAEEQIYLLAFYDALTGLPNRARLVEQLQKALQTSARTGRQGALLFLDLDNFKVLNDTMGHEMGDRLLQAVATRLRDCVRESDSVARLGGDEFLVIIEALPSDPDEAAHEALRIGRAILAALDEPYDIGANEHCTTASIGIALFGDGTQGVDGLMRQADLAMYQAKARGRNMLCTFDASMQRHVDARLALDIELRKALQGCEMRLYYQAQVVDDGTITGAEVLVRWMHPVRGLVYPAAFIPAAESSGLIVPLGTWVLRTACEQLAAWANDPHLARLTLSVNVSVRQFRETHFVDQVLATVAVAGADPHKLKLEITETLFAENMPDISEKMHALKAHGIGFSLDDFGTGYSSLKYLQRLPLDQLKIDRTFVQDLTTNPNDSAITLAIISLGEKLGLRVIAEGVETAEQRAFLFANGCSAYQGFYFSEPVALHEFEQAVGALSRRGTMPPELAHPTIL